MKTAKGNVTPLAVQPGGEPTSTDLHPAWESPAYTELAANGLLRSDWRKTSIEELDFRAGNATPGANCLFKCIPLFWFCPLLHTAEVQAGSIRKFDDGRGGFGFLGNSGPKQGVHRYIDLFLRIKSKDVPLNDAGELVVQHGDCWIVVVPQGFIGLAMDMGQPVLLPPGMHQWKSGTMKFEKNIDLNNPVIHMGPYTLLTVDKGYEAVTQNNGRQQVLSGGAVHLLKHRNWKFEKFITTKIQTDNLQRIAVMTGDNVLMQVDATVCWSIVDVQQCAERAAETMSHTGNTKAGDKAKNTSTIAKLRNDVLKQAEASLSALVGKVNFSSTFSAATELAAGTSASSAVPVAVGVVESGSNAAKSMPTASALLFDVDKLQNSVQHANEMTTRYGVKVMSINIISAQPSDEGLLQSLAKGAVAAAEKTQCVLKAQGEADALKISAKADAEAEVMRAEGSKTAAELLTSEDVAVQLAVMQAAGNALKGAKSSVILGNDVSAVGGMLMANKEFSKGKF